jgi:hypothetical protein
MGGDLNKFKEGKSSFFLTAENGNELIIEVENSDR